MKLTHDGNTVSETFTTDDGTFTLTNIPAGDYRLEASDSGYVSISITVNIDDNQKIMLPLMILQAGDLNGDNLINQRDLTILAQDYDLGRGDVPPSADLNHDGVIDLTDLQMLAANLGA